MKQEWHLNIQFITYKCPKKSTFLKFQVRKYIWNFLTTLDRFIPCQIILDTSESYGPFLILWTNMDRFGRVGPVDNHGLFGPFGLGPVWTVGDHLDCLDHFLCCSPNGPKWSKIVQTVQNDPNSPNGPKWSKQSKMVQTVQNGPDWSTTGPRLSKTGWNGPKRSIMDGNDPKWSRVVQNGP